MPKKQESGRHIEVGECVIRQDKRGKYRVKILFSAPYFTAHDLAKCLRDYLKFKSTCNILHVCDRQLKLLESGPDLVL